MHHNEYSQEYWKEHNMLGESNIMGMQEDSTCGYKYIGSRNSIIEFSFGSIVLDQVMLGMATESKGEMARAWTGLSGSSSVIFHCHL